VDEDAVAGFVPAEEFFGSDYVARNLGDLLDVPTSPGQQGNVTSRSAGEGAGATRKYFLPPGETQLTAGVHVEPLFAEPTHSLNGHVRPEDSAGNPQTRRDQHFSPSGDEISLGSFLLGKNIELPAGREKQQLLPSDGNQSETVVPYLTPAARTEDHPDWIQDPLDSVNRDQAGQWRTIITQPADPVLTTASAAGSPLEQAGTWTLVEPDKDGRQVWLSEDNTESHSPRLLSSMAPDQLDVDGSAAKEGVSQATTKRDARGSLYKYYGNQQFVGVADSQGELSALVSYLDQQPKRKQGRLVDNQAVLPAQMDRAEKGGKSPVYIRQEEADAASRTMMEASRKTGEGPEVIPSKEEMRLDISPSTTRKSGINRAGYSYSGFDFIDR
jgi:hypothetical protein